MANSALAEKRSSAGNPALPSASRPGNLYEAIPRGVPMYTLITWTLGRGSVIWRIWPAVLFHTLFSAIVVTLSLEGIINLEIPNIMLTVLGVVIGFVISYRASSGYDRYWTGRTCWSDVMGNARTLGRLVWFHVPPRLSAKTAEELNIGQVQRSPQELNKVMAEKKMALDLIEGFAVALKHHIRGELGIYYEDLYHLVRPMHDYERHADGAKVSPTLPPSMGKFQDTTAHPSLSKSQLTPPTSSNGETSEKQPLNLGHSDSQFSQQSNSSESHPPLRSTHPGEICLGGASSSLVPFAWLWNFITGSLTSKETALLVPKQPLNGGRHWRGPIHPGLHSKCRPNISGTGENLPLEVLRCLSEWCSVLEDRGTVPGSSLGPMIGTLAAFEENLTALEKILTTPLPFVYSVHIRHTVWIYLFFLPFQLVKQFGYFTIAGVALASFIYLGFLAAGEEIEQPFGYDENDLDLDLFCHEIIHSDIESLKSSPCLNAYFGPEYPEHTNRQSLTVVGIAHREKEAGEVLGPTS